MKMNEIPLVLKLRRETLSTMTLTEYCVSVALTLSVLAAHTEMLRRGL